MRALIFALLAGCSAGDSLVVVSVDSTAPLTNVASLHTLSGAGGRNVTHDLPTTQPLGPDAPQTFGVRVPGSIGGMFTIHIEARDGAGDVLAAGDGMTQLDPGHRRDISITLGLSQDDSGAIVDLSAPGDGSSDLARLTDMAAAPDLTARDLATPPDLSQTILHINPDHDDFGSLNEGSTSTEAPFTVSNISTGSAGILTATISGTDAAQFALSTDTCTGNPLFSMTSCNLGVTFHPALAGPRSAAVTITSDSLGVIGTIPLTGASVGDLGRACTGDQYCQPMADGGTTGQCVDGYCCNLDATTCAGCRACNVSGKEGSCSPIAVGTDPKGFCTQPCADKCDGAGACRPKTAGVICQAGGVCSNTSYASEPQIRSTLMGNHYCDGSSLACPAATLSTSPCPNSYVCDTSTGNCKTSCTVDYDCIGGHFCSSGVCTASFFFGATCTRNAQCQNTVFPATGGGGICDNGTCKECVTNADCGGHLCQSGHCVPCGSSNDCIGSGWGSTCSSGYCTGCSNDCTWGTAPICASTYCRCNSGGFLCGGWNACINAGPSGECKIRPGWSCGQASDCSTGSCVNHVCQ